MSRHFLDCEYRVTLGYDRPLDQFFLQVARLPSDPAQDEESPFVYASIDDPNDRCNLEYYWAKLRELGITVPATMFLEVSNDAFNRVGNRYVQHFADGRFVEPVPN